MSTAATEHTGARRTWTVIIVGALVAALTGAGLGLLLLGDDADRSTFKTSADRERVYELGDGARLVVPPNSVSPHAVVTAERGPAPVTDVADGAQLLGSPVELSIDGELLAPVTIEFPYDAQQYEPSDVGIATLDPTTGQWMPVPSIADPVRGMVTASTPHFSFWSSIRDFVFAFFDRIVQDFGELVGTRAGAARCPTDVRLPNWVSDVSVTNDANAPLRGCVRSEGNTVAIELVNNRPYGVVVSFGVPVAWAWAERGASLVDMGVGAATPPPSDGLYLPALSRGSVGINRGDWASANFLARPRWYTIGLDVLLDVLSVAKVADAKGAITAITKALTGDCARLLLTTDATTDPANLVDAITASAPCLRDALSAAIQRGMLTSSQALDKTSHVLDELSKLGKALQVIKIANRYLELLRDGGLGLYGGFTVLATPTPGARGGPAASTPAPAPAADAPVFTVMNTSETPPDGVWFRNSPSTADTDRVTGHGVYAREQVRLDCYVWGEAVGKYGNRLWYSASNVSRPTNKGTPNTGFLNAHYVDDGRVANEVVAGVPQC